MRENSSMKYWLHRIKHLMNVSYPFLEKGYLSIGFSDFCEQEFLDEIYSSSYTDAWQVLESEFKLQWGGLSRRRYFLWNFLREMKKGDIVLVPSWGTFSLYEILEDNAILANNTNSDYPETDWTGTRIIRDPKYNMLMLEGSMEYLDLGFLRRVKLICKDIPRSDYADSRLTSRMKIQSTNSEISDLKTSIERALKLFKEKTPINFKKDLLEGTVNTWNSIIKEDLGPKKFEKLVKWYFSKIGATSVYMPSQNYKNKQGDADVIATFEKIKTIISVQVKFYKGETSDWAVDQIIDFAKSSEGSSEDYNSQFWVISSSDSFSDVCRKKARENNIRLINGREFTSMLLDVGIESLEIFDD